MAESGDSAAETGDTGDSDTSPDTDSDIDETADTGQEHTGLAGDLSLDTAADAALLGSGALAFEGHAAVAPVGDVNGDGIPDLVVGLRVVEVEWLSA